VLHHTTPQEFETLIYIQRSTKEHSRAGQYYTRENNCPHTRPCTHTHTHTHAHVYTCILTYIHTQTQASQVTQSLSKFSTRTLEDPSAVIDWKMKEKTPQSDTPWFVMQPVGCNMLAALVNAHSCTCAHTHTHTHTHYTHIHIHTHTHTHTPAHTTHTYTQHTHTYTQKKNMELVGQVMKSLTKKQKKTHTENKPKQFSDLTHKG